MNHITNKIIGCAIEVHKNLGPGLLESVYEECLSYEISNTGLLVERQKPVPIIYKNFQFNCGFRMDLLVNNDVIVELKTVESLNPAHEAQILTYMKLAHKPLGLLINFNVKFVVSGIKRYINTTKI